MTSDISCHRKLEKSYLVTHTAERKTFRIIVYGIRLMIRNGRNGCCPGREGGDKNTTTIKNCDTYKESMNIPREDMSTYALRWPHP